MIRVMMVGDHEIFRAGVRAILDTTIDIKVVSETPMPRDALLLVGSLGVDLMILGQLLTAEVRLDLLRQGRKQAPGLRFLVITSPTDTNFIQMALKAGATGFLTSDCSAVQVIDAVRKVISGRLYVSEDFVQELILGQFAADEPCGHQSLTARQYDIFMRLAEGQTCTQVAQELSRSIKTISTHKSRIMDKMHLNSTADLVQYALAHNLVARLDEL